MNTLKRVVKDAALSFVYFTAVLTPYMIFVVHVDKNQYIAWLGMQAILVPPAGAGFAWLLRKVTGKEGR